MISLQDLKEAMSNKKLHRIYLGGTEVVETWNMGEYYYWTHIHVPIKQSQKVRVRFESEVFYDLELLFKDIKAGIR